jgi:hypothetical protein
LKRILSPNTLTAHSQTAGLPFYKGEEKEHVQHTRWHDDNNKRAHNEAVRIRTQYLVRHQIDL